MSIWRRFLVVLMSSVCAVGYGLLVDGVWLKEKQIAIKKVWFCRAFDESMQENVNTNWSK